MADIILGFVAIGGIIFIGFFARLIFEKTKIPDILFLVILGLFLGPFLLNAFQIELVPKDVLGLVTPAFAALALAMILFDGGLNLSFDLVVRKLKVSLIHTVTAFILTVMTISLVAHFVLGYPITVGLLLGSILGGLSGAIAVTTVRSMRLTEDTRTILTLESVLTDVLCIVVSLSIIEYLKGGPNSGPEVAMGTLATAFSIAIVIGVFFGVIWLIVLTRLYGKPFSYMITLAALLLLYGGVEFVKGSGAMAALIFGIVIGNKEEFGSFFRIKTKFHLDERIIQFHSELSFLIRTFFFVLLGLSFSFAVTGSVDVFSHIPFLSSLDYTPTLFLIGAALIFVVIVLSRYVNSFLTIAVHPESKNDQMALTTMMGRGLAAAVLATLAFTIPAFTDPAAPGYTNYHDLMSPYQSQFLNLSFLIILSTVVATTIGVFFSEKRDVGKTELELAKERLLRKKEIEEKKRWKRERAEKRRQRIRMKKHKKRSKK
ncbi:MAG: cation:proton antiporter [Thermoplasmata archaeon]